MKVVTRELLAGLTAEALGSPRLRKNHNIHHHDGARCHRLLNAIEPPSYIRPHRHLDPEKDEGFILISGALGVVTFHDDGGVRETVLLSPVSGNVAVDIPHGVFHTAVSLESGTVFYEAKAGPYLPLTEAEKPAWAPEENTTAAREYLAWLRELFPGSS